MKCEICHQAEATVHFKQVANGEVREMFVCADCADENGLAVQSPTSLTDFLFGVGVEESEDEESEARTCPSCGMTTEAFHEGSRLGCPCCYETFEEEIASVLEDMHAGTRHVGKVPEGERVDQRVSALQAALEKAVAGQNFEEAARLRDELKALAQQAASRARTR